MLHTLVRPAATHLAPPSHAWCAPPTLPTAPTLSTPPAPVLRLRQLPIDAQGGGGKINLDAWPGELVHLGGGSQVQRQHVLHAAAGLAHRGHPTPAELGHVLCDAPLPACLSVPDCVAGPLVAEGLGHADAYRRAELELYLLGASALRQRQPQSLTLLEARQVRLARATVARPALLVLAWPDRGLGPEAAGALRLVLSTLACTFGSCVLLTSDDPRLKASADRHIDLDRLG